MAGWTVDSVLNLANDGEHWLAHFVLAKKLLGETQYFAVRVANAFEHHRLTRDEVEGMIADWQEEGWPSDR